MNSESVEGKPTGKTLRGNLHKSMELPVTSVAEASLLAKGCDCAAYSSLLVSRMRHRQIKNLIADVMDAIHEYLNSLLHVSAVRLKTMERVAVFSLNLHGVDESVAAAMAWSRREDELCRESLEGAQGLRTQFWNVMKTVGRVNQAIDARLEWIDGFARKLASTRKEWKKDTRGSMERDNPRQTGILQKKNEELLAQIAALEGSIGTIGTDLDQWMDHARDVLTPCFLALFSTFAVPFGCPEDRRAPIQAAQKCLRMVDFELQSERMKAVLVSNGIHVWPESIKEFLSSAFSRAYFSQFLQVTGGSENLEFLVAMMNYREKYGKTGLLRCVLSRFLLPILFFFHF